MLALMRLPTHGEGNTEMSDYAWVIDTDHLDGTDGDAGVIGPRDARGDDKSELSANYAHRHQFRMYDDDGELYYTGTLFWDGDADNPEEHQVYGPLGDYGMPGAGCVVVKYTGQPGWECG